METLLCIQHISVEGIMCGDRDCRGLGNQLGIVITFSHVMMIE